MKKIIFILSLISLSPSFASSSKESAVRDLDQDYTYYLKNFVHLTSSSPVGRARRYNEASLPHVIHWRSKREMQARFESIRDERFLTAGRDPELRRISWLYPKDGCYVRASLFNRNAFRLFVPIPNKVFAFGNLRVKTPNARGGVVGWWYHVAPIVQVGNTKYVLDPSIEPKNPLPLKEWLGRMGAPEKIKVAICGSGTYSPGDNCYKTTDGMELGATDRQEYYLKLEEEELKRLGRNPDAELGDAPPW